MGGGRDTCIPTDRERQIDRQIEKLTKRYTEIGGEPVDNENNFYRTV